MADVTDIRLVRRSFSFCLLWCCAFHLITNQADAVSAKEVMTLNYPVKDQRIRIKREKSNFVDRNDCEKNEPVNTVHGFLKLEDKNYTVQFIKDHGKYCVEVSWEAPLGENNNSPVGYWFSWLVYRDTSATQGYSFVCTFLTAENTSFVVFESYHWRRDEPIAFMINPLPKKSNSTADNSFSFPYTPQFTDLDLKTTKRASTRPKEILTNTITESTTSDKTSRRSAKINFLAASAEKTEQNKKKEIFTFVTVTIACTAILMLGVILALRYCKRKQAGRQADCVRDPGYIYVSYLSESKGHTNKVVDFGSWLRKHGYNVQMDIMLSPSNQNNLKELGRQRWGEKQLFQAKNVFIILSPSYLNLCRLDEGTTDASSLTQEEKIIYNEITQIRNELSSKAYISSRFIPVLFGVKETEIPFWIKQLVVYSWPDDKMNNKLLYRISEEISYENATITDSKA